ncbi:MAG TPA: enolase C-terminal domain-like protein [Acidimicrobiia bacterium]|nr:enolase C-terminal domain-like protein [Acidimicrobiia bacterium]
MREHRLRIGDRAVTLVAGPAGWGESSPLPGYTCEPEASRRAAEEAACDGWPPPRRDVVPVNALVDEGPVEPAALAGFSAVKVKVGRRNPEDDVALVAAVRDAIQPGVALRVDANGAWDLDTAAAMVHRLARWNLELVEQPVAGLEDLARLRRRVDVALAADECVRSVDDARCLAALDAADAVVLKVQPLGGVRAALDVADVAGVPALVTSMRETSIGIAAGLALAAALPELPYACGLAARMSGGDVVAEPLAPVDGRLRVRRVAPDPKLLGRYEVMG